MKLLWVSLKEDLMNTDTILDIKTKVLQGIPASDGIAIGKIVMLHKSSKKINKFIQKNRIESEKLRVEQILAELIEEYTAISSSLEKNEDNLSEIYESHALVLQDIILKKEIFDLVEKGISGEYAIQTSYNNQIEKLKSSDNQLLRERSNDLDDLKNIILQRLSENEDIKIPKGSIIFSKYISTKDLYIFLQKGAVGFVTEKGGITSHASIIARSFDIPYIFGVKNILKNCHKDEDAILDAYTGKVFINPDIKIKKDFQKRIIEIDNDKKMILKLKDRKSETLDGKQIHLKSNLDHSSEIIDLKFAGADGIGLVRTENVIEGKFIFDENKQYEIYREIVANIFPNKATIRLFDYGSDKPPKGFIFKEANPALGLRGIRFLLSNPGILDTQLQAILRASSAKNLDIMIPMVALKEEVVEVKRRLELNKEILKETGYNFDSNLKIGIMLEIPSVYYKMDEFADLVDFYSIGTNDLMQYFFAADRINDKVSNFHNFKDISFFKFLNDIISKIKKQGKPVSICGELAQSKESIESLIGMGIEELSVPVSKVLEIKNEIRKVNSKQARKNFNKLIKS